MELAREQPSGCGLRVLGLLMMDERRRATAERTDRGAEMRQFGWTRVARNVPEMAKSKVVRIISRQEATGNITRQTTSEMRADWSA